MERQQNETYCQSCAMPMKSDELYGTNSDGTKTEEFCKFCFQNGQFTEPDITMQEMIDKCVSIMGRQNIMPEDQARDLMTKHLPNLNRWKSV